MKAISRNCAATGAAFLLLCTTGLAADDSGFLSDYSQLKPIAGTEIRLYTAPGAYTEVKKYTAVMIDQPEIVIADDSKYKGIKPDDAKLIADNMRKALGEAVTKTKTTEEWLLIFEKFEIASAPINTVEQAFEDPGILATNMVKTMEHPIAGMIKVLNKPWKMSESPGDEQLPPPPLGWHTFEVLKEAGYAEEDIISLKNKGVIEGKSPTTT